MKILKALSSLLFLVLIAVVLTWFFAPDYLKKLPVLAALDLPTPTQLLKQSRGESVIEHARKHSDPSYVCPMHPKIVRDEPGSCPICGMDLVKKEVEAAPQNAEQESVIEHALKHSDPAYVCPMHPQIVKDEPGSCPICGMDLVRKEPIKTKDKSLASRNELPKISIKANTAQQMGVRTAEVSRKKLSRVIHTVGSITYNEDSLHHIHPRASGWVEKVHVKAEGDAVKRGRPLLEFYSPEIVGAQKDLILARQSGNLYSARGSDTLVNSAKQKMRLYEVPENIIERVLNSGQSQDLIPILAPQTGVIVQMGIRDGMYVTPSTQMYSIADLSSIWVMVDVFEHQLDWISPGNSAEMQVQGLPGRTWSGEVDYIYPELNPVNRSLQVRLKFNTPKQELKPNMFADVTLYSPAKSTLSIPAEAVIYYSNNSRVVKVVGEHQYQPVEIKTGIKSGGQVEVLSGLKAGDQIVVSGQFMLDSESNLQASFRRMME